jgi:hypothetical protein
MFTVQLATDQGTCYLRGTVWTFAGRVERASHYETAGQARDALNKAKPFMKAAHYKAARIVEND